MTPKKMPKAKERGRLIILSFLAAGVCGAYILNLMNFQVVRGAEFQAQTQQLTVSKISVKAARGEILDCSGVALAENKVGYNVVFYYSFFPKADQNRIIAGLIEMLEKNGEDWYDPLPLTLAADPVFEEGRDKDIETLRNKLGVNVYATASDCMYNLRELFGIDESCDDLTARKIAGVRYGMVLSDFSINNNQYAFAEDVSTDTALLIKEMSHLLPGVDIVDEDIRVYPQGTVAPHIVGVIGKMYAEEYYGTTDEGGNVLTEGYKDKGYKMDSLVGKLGIEQAMEAELHGIDGVKTVEQSKDGSIISEEITTAPESGNNVVLTIDSAFQKKVQDILEAHILMLRERKSDSQGDHGNKAEGGSIVVLDAKTGGVLAAATYPGYDLNNYFSDYASIRDAEFSPLNNRAFNGLYRPGSTFKTAVAAGALEEGVITPADTVNCQRVYRYYDILPGNQFRPTCLGYHGKTDAVKALTVSCNIFFYDVGRRLGADQMNVYANLLGLGVPTGIELSESVGGISGPERSQSLGKTWVQGDICQAAIGQMDTNVTPLQMAVQAMTLANRGARYQAHLVKEVRSYDDAEILSSTQKKVLSQFEMSDSTFETIKDGMIGAAARVPAPYQLTDLGYDVALKTGTPQKNNTEFHSAAIAFAPADDADIAISVMLELGDNANYLIRQILEAYYATASGSDTEENSSLSSGEG
ncbi:MAG: peptidoglycan D,D-transpeptidase FtsI family protein [Candidatus Merdivicinus sp.]|jgi:penicillin-binding protein 2